jgi:hypothetical protein
VEVQIAEAQLSDSVTKALATAKMSGFTNAEFADMHFVFVFCDDNSFAVLR